MGNSHPSTVTSEELGRNLQGFRVLTLSPDSPAAHAGLEVFFDFIVGVDDAPVLDMNAFLDVIWRSENKKISLTVINLRLGTERRLACIPQRWSGPGLLGASVAQERVLDAYAEGLRVVQVLKTSPADLAGLNPRTDFLIACTRGIFREISDFETAMADEQELLVFSSVDKSVRTVKFPAISDHSDGAANLGLSLGQGALDALPLEKFPIAGVSGLQMLRVHEGGPVHACGQEISDFIEPIFSFVTLVNGKSQESQTAFAARIEEAEISGNSATLTVWNSRLDETREFSVSPRSDWGGSGRLGASLKFLANMHEHGNAGLHVLEVFPKSPAADAGLIGNHDYLLASDDTILFTMEDLEIIVAKTKAGDSLPLTVFSAKTGKQRQLTITPNPKWGGRGSLGCDLGFGAMHRPPKFLEESTSPFLQAAED